MTIDRFRKVLEATGPPPDARELSELLWLACHLPPPEGDRPPEGRDAEPTQPTGVAPPPYPAIAPPDPPRDPMRDPARDPTPSVPVMLPSSAPDAGGSAAGAQAGDAAGDAAGVLVPTAPMLADPRGVQRALRPLKRRVPSAHRFELDEDATAARIADTGIRTPVLVPSPERWLSLTLVVDTGPTMRLWRPLAGELAETLVRLGAFRDVHVRHLGTTGRVTTATGAPSQDPGTLLDSSGRHAVLVLSDCCGPHWWNGRAARAVRRWARAGPTAIVQPLAERLWRRTAAPAAPGLAFLPRPGAANTDLRFAPHDGTAPPGVPVPVLEAEPRWFGAWARLVSGNGPQPAAVTTLPPRPPGTPPPARERELPIADRVRRFLASASPEAAELAAHVAVSVPSLPVMRLIQHRVLGRSGPGQLAEVLLSGLLRPAGGARYEFVPGAREALLDTLPRPEAQHTRRVLDLVSAEIERRAGTSGERFRALTPAEGGPFTLTADTDHFALVTPETRSALAPPIPPPEPDFPTLLDIQDADVDELLGDWDRPLGPVPIGVDHGQTVTLDVLARSEYGAHGLITGPRDRRDALLRTLVFSLALRHSPHVVNVAFADFSGGMSFVGLATLPHVALGVHPTSAESPQFDRLLDALEIEQRHRDAILRIAGTTRWDDYQAAVAAGRPLEPLPALLVVIDNAGPLLRERPELIEPLYRLCERLPSRGIVFLFCTPDDVPLPPEVSAFLGWQMGVPDRGREDEAFLHVPGEVVHPSFRPARITLGEAAPFVNRMRGFSPRARRLPLPPEPGFPGSEPPGLRLPEVDPPETGSPVPALAAPAQAAPERGDAPSEESPFGAPSAVFPPDVLTLNGGGDPAVFEAAWEVPPQVPREPVIGHDPDGEEVTLPPLDVSSGIPHGLIVGDTEARQHIVRDIALSLAASHSPSDVAFAFAGLREHPLDRPIALPHVLHSADELLRRPTALRRLLDVLSAELDARDDPAHGRPGLIVFVDVSLTFPSAPEVLHETLFKLAESGAPRGVRLLVASSTVEDTAVWNRLLPLLHWRVTANRLPPAVLQRVHGRADLPFTEERTAYLSSGGAPRLFIPASDAPSETISAFVERAYELHADAALPRLLETDAGAEAPAVWTMLRSLYIAERKAIVWGPPDRHLFIVEGDSVLVARATTLYGRLLAALGVLAHGEVLEAAVDQRGRVLDEPDSTLDDLFRAGRGGVLLIRRRATDDYLIPPMPGLPEHLRASMGQYWNDPIVVLPVDHDEEVVFRRHDPFFDDRFSSIRSLTSLPPSHEVWNLLGREFLLGTAVETGEPAVLDLEADRHLLVTGPTGPTRRNLLRRLLDMVIGAGDERYSLVYILDARRRLGLPDEVTARPNVRYTEGHAEFGSLLEEALERVRKRRRSGYGPEVFIFAAGRARSKADPLMSLGPSLGPNDYDGPHLILSTDDPTPDPLIRTLGLIGAPALLTGPDDHASEMWNVPEDVAHSPSPNQAVLAHKDRYRVIRLRTPDDQ